MDASCSIIIPTANRPTELARALASLAPYARSERRLEILVIDGGDPAETSEVVRRFAQLYPITRYIQETVPGRLSGRHRGALESRGDVLCFLDDDVETAPGWYSALMSTFGDPQVQLACGPSLPRYAAQPPTWLDSFVSQDRQAWRLPLLGLLDFGPRVHRVDARLVPGLNLAVRRQTVFDHGGFHPDRMPAALQRWQGDGERGLLQHLQNAGQQAVYHPGARVHHHVPAERLTIEYLEFCAARLAVADSFAALRREHGLTDAERPRWWPSPLQRALSKGGAFGPRRYAFNDVRQRVAAAYRSGYQIHQQEVERDARLRSWVLRSDFWDYALPPVNEPAARPAPIFGAELLNSGVTR